MTKILLAVAFSAVLIITAFQFYGIAKDTVGLEEEAELLRNEANALTKENQETREKIDYLGKAENLIQEIKTKFNYRLPEEKTIIVAPEKRD
ncbi:MAG: hypothetical protein PHP35_00710 [Candidatus Colwellbacteria bacterium]|nr:hypothetical protein [Candidatus Colwellbacteria bacterium]